MIKCQWLGCDLESVYPAFRYKTNQYRLCKEHLKQARESRDEGNIVEVVHDGGTVRPDSAA